MNLRDLDYILAVTETGHFGRAAASRHVSQPTLSGQILKLEKELGLKIFERAGRRARLTQAGEKVVAEARRAMSAARAIQEIAAVHRDPLVGPLRLGMIPTIAPYLAPRLLPQARRTLPDSPLILVEDFTDNLLPALEQGELDAAIIATPLHGERLAALPLYEERLFLVMSKSHVLARKKQARAAEIPAAELLLLKEGHCLRDQAAELCAQNFTRVDAHERGRADASGSSLETLLHLAAAGYGVTIAPESAVLAFAHLNAPAAACPIVAATRAVSLTFRPTTPRKKLIEILANMIYEQRAYASGSQD